MVNPKNTDYKRAFNEQNYDRVAVTIPKGQTPAVEAHAKNKGQSVNGLVNTLLRADMGLTADEWKGRAEE